MDVPVILVVCRIFCLCFITITQKRRVYMSSRRYQTSRVSVSAPRYQTSRISISAPRYQTSRVSVSAPRYQTRSFSVSAPRYQTSRVSVSAPRYQTSRVSALCTRDVQCSDSPSEGELLGMTRVFSFLPSFLPDQGMLTLS